MTTPNENEDVRQPGQEDTPEVDPRTNPRQASRIARFAAPNADFGRAVRQPRTRPRPPESVARERELLGIINPRGASSRVNPEVTKTIEEMVEQQKLAEAETVEVDPVEVNEQAENPSTLSQMPVDDNDPETKPAMLVSNVYAPQTSVQATGDKKGKRTLADSKKDREAAERKRDTSLRDANPFMGEEATKSASESVKKINRIHNVYAHEMVRACFRDFEADMSIQTVISSLSTAAVMWTLSPAFREMANDFGDSVRKRVDEFFTERIGNKLSEAKRKIFFQKNYNEKKGSAEKEAEKEHAYLTSVKQSTDHFPMDVENAAHNLLTQHENAYYAVRNGANPEKVAEKLDKMTIELRNQWADDGVPYEDVKVCMQELIGQRSAEDPRYASMFVDYAHGFISPTQAKKRKGDSNPSWDGRWAMANGRLYDADSIPSPVFRPWMSMDQHVTAMGTSIATTLLGAYERGGVKAFHETLVGFSSWESHPGNPAAMHPSGGNPMDHASLAQRRMYIMQMALIDDGASPADVHNVSMDALKGGLQAVFSSTPELKKIYDETYKGDVLVKDAEKFGKKSKGKMDLDLSPRFDHDVIEGVTRSQAAQRAGVVYIAPDGTVPQAHQENQDTTTAQRDTTTASVSPDAGEREAKQKSVDNRLPETDPRAGKGGPDWRRRTQEGTAKEHVAVVKSELQTDGQRQQTQARNSSYDANAGDVEVAEVSHDNPNTTEVDEAKEGRPSNSAAIARRVQRNRINMQFNNEDEQDKQARGKDGKEAPDFDI